MCLQSPESQLCSGLHQKKYGQHAEGGDPAPQLRATKASPGVLHPDLGSSGQEIYRPVGLHPEDGQENGPRDGTPPLHGQAERPGAVQPGEEKALRIPESGLSVTKGGERLYKKVGDRLFSKFCCDRLRGNGFKQKEERFRLGIRKKFFTIRVAKHLI